MRGIYSNKSISFGGSNLPLSDKTIHMLSKSIRSQLLPEPMEVDSPCDSKPSDIESKLPQTTIDTAIQTVAERVNYGVEQSQYGVGRMPAALCLWRWEVKDMTNLPIQLRYRAHSRKSDRMLAKEEIKGLLASMSSADKIKALGLKAAPLSYDSKITMPASHPAVPV